MKKAIMMKISNIGIVCVISICLMFITSCSKSPIETDISSQSPVIAKDTTAPTISSVNPADASTSVSISSPNISAIFSEKMDASTINSSNFTLATQAGVPATGSATYDSASNKALFTPASSLSYSTAYTATIKTGVKDSAGNAIAVQKTWGFTTQSVPDTTPPSVISVNPTNEATGVATSTAVSVVFSESIDTDSIISPSTNFTLRSAEHGIESGNVTYDAAAKKAIFTPASNLAGGITYSATISASVKDSSGNQIGTPYTWTFSTLASIEEFTLTSSSFLNGGQIPVKHAYTSVTGGLNRSIPLAWTNVPIGTLSFALVMYDADVNTMANRRWMVIDIPSNTTSFAENIISPSGSHLLFTDYGPIYFGPANASGTTHTYIIELSALNVATTNLSIFGYYTLSEFKAAIESSTIKKASLTGTFTR